MTFSTIQDETALLEAALIYAQAGFRVFPTHTVRNGVCTCRGAKRCAPGKHPIGVLVPRGLLDASTDAEVIKRWWAQIPDANIGIATGKGSGIVGLDVDGPHGEKFLAEMESKHGPLPPTRQVKTGKGRHLYFRYLQNATQVKSVARRELGLDVRADGGYLIAPPSSHESGRRYAFEENGVDELADCPDWVVAYANGQLRLDATESGNGSKLTRAEPVTSYSEAEENKLRSALASIPADERDTWRDIGAALHSLNWSETGFAIWSDWSRSCAEKYSDADQQGTWESFDRPYQGTRITTASLFYKARQHGWIDESGKDSFRTDLGNAHRLVKRHGENVRYIPEWGKWIVWNSSRWDIDEDGAIMRLAKETVEAMYPEALSSQNEEDRTALLRHAMKSQAEARIKAMVSLAESEATVVLAARKLDADPWLLGVQNGVIDLKTGQFRPARREDLITKRANVTYNPRARWPQWLKFLKTITGGDRAVRRYMQRVAGYALTGSVREEVAFVLYGIGNNGKSTFRETLHASLGDYALAADTSLLTERKKAGGATEELARLKGRRFVAVNETAENDQLNELRVKFITSQDMITARNLYGHFFDFFPTHKTFLTTNHKPIVRGTDEGIWRRLQLIPFTVTIDKSAVEKDFRERRLMPELSGILNWALAGLAAYRKQGLNPPVAVLVSTQDYRQDMDVVGQWLGERCVRDPKASVPTRDAYKDYTEWAAEEVGWEIRMLTFRRHLSDRGFGAKKTHAGRMIVGLRLNPVEIIGTATYERQGGTGIAEEDHATDPVTR